VEALGQDGINPTGVVDFGAAETTGVVLDTVNGFGTGTGGGFDAFALLGVTAVLGTAGNDTVTMTTTSDVTIDGRGGADTLTGGAGNDLLDGGADADNLTGGGGTDRFVLAVGTGTDIVEDFADGIDKISVSGVLFSDITILASGSTDTEVRLASGDSLILRNVIPSQITEEGFIGLSPPPDVTNDFNGDGTSDILWFNAVTGGVGQFEMNNGSATWRSIGTSGANWEVAGTGDFNGDGTDDILWFNTATNSVGQFEMINGSPTWKSIGMSGANWEVAGTGDFNGDGTDDILWFNTATDAVGQFEMNNGSLTWRSIGTGADFWEIIG